MTNSASVDGYMHIEGFEAFERDAFDKRQVRAGMRKAGLLVLQRAQMNLALGKGQAGYPVNRTGATLHSINAKVSRSGFLVRVAPSKSKDMAAFYPAYLHYGVRNGPRIKGRGGKRRARGERQALREARRQSGWRIAPRDNYMSDALQDSRADVQRVLQAAFAAALN
ncbi:hypothetical protein [Pseudomonas sp. Au-Pse12]|uniref:hypothetical protein n=1 Tax=Pseudomonas sp. Au-Pse12 TaxID=2906459 RepID=UPI001E363E0D|nr:hypothetical protein [Pseudomonas sp. Au-Pse12]MCE4058453.1 hypothetical protein [Pseudomonas sp. Au-Pse12]